MGSKLSGPCFPIFGINMEIYGLLYIRDHLPNFASNIKQFN